MTEPASGAAPQAAVPGGPSDEELFERVRAGDQEGLTLLAGRYERELFAFLYQLTGGDTHRADDFFQETFLRALRARETFDKTKPFRPWLLAIALNAVRDDARRRKTQGEVVRLDADPPPDVAWAARGEGPAAAAERHDEDAQVRRALGELREAEREIVLLHFYEGLTLVEVAGVLEIPVGTVKSRLHSALTRLKEVLGRNEDEHA